MDNIKKILKALPTGAQEELEAMDEATLRAKIVEASNNIRTAQAEMMENDDYLQSREAYKLAAEPFKDAIKAQRAVVGYALALLESKGKL